MAQAKWTETVERSAPEVFAAIVDVDAYPLWNPTTENVRLLTPGRLSEGGRFEITAKGFGSFEVEVKAFEENRRIHFHSVTPTAVMDHVYVLVPEEQRTRVDQVLEVRPGGFQVLLSPLMGMMLRKNLRTVTTALKAYVERPIEPAGAGVAD